MPFEKGNKHSTGRKPGSKNKSNILANALDVATGNEIGSNAGAEEVLSGLLTDVVKDIRNGRMSHTQRMEALKILAPYFAAKHSSLKAEKTINDNTVSTQMQMDLQAMKFKILEIEAENRALKKDAEKPSFVGYSVTETASKQ